MLELKCCREIDLTAVLAEIRNARALRSKVSGGCIRSNLGSRYRVIDSCRSSRESLFNSDSLIFESLSESLNPTVSYSHPGSSVILLLDWLYSVYCDPLLTEKESEVVALWQSF